MVKCQNLKLTINYVSFNFNCYTIKYGNNLILYINSNLPRSIKSKIIHRAIKESKKGR